jgi:formylglycine-generating enzyme required for sulfatase activity
MPSVAPPCTGSPLRVEQRSWAWVLAAIIVVTASAWIFGCGEARNGAPKGSSTKRASTGPAAGAKRINPKDSLTYVWIQPGTFTMGCSPGDNDCFPAEEPRHQVTITKGFWMGQTEVTQAAYERVIGSNPSGFKGTSLPVETINWDEARAYCVAVDMRLPTEAEWEYAARGGNSSARYGPLDAVAWYASNSGGKTHDVGQKQANAYGLHDMLGNVWEWIADWAEKYSSSSVTDPQGPSGRIEKVLRGDSWSWFVPMGARASSRDWSEPYVRNNFIGVRCAGD